MKRGIMFLVLAIFLSSFTYAILEDELAACGDNVRCKFRVAAKHEDFDACDSLEGRLGENCENFAVGEEKASEIRSSQQAKLDKTSTPLVVVTSAVAGIIIAIIGFLFLVLFLFFERYRHKLFIKDHTDLVNYVRNSLDKSISEDVIISKLRSVGWKEDMIKEAIKDAKKSK